jgi:hypothetical protein
MVSQRRAMSRQRPHKTCRRESEKFSTTTRKTLLHATVGSYGYASIVGCSKRANTKILEGHQRAKTRLETFRLVSPSHSQSLPTFFVVGHTFHLACIRLVRFRTPIAMLVLGYISPPLLS